MSESENKSVKKRNRGHNKRIGFSEEIVTKDAATTLLSSDSTDESNGQKFFSKLVSEEPRINGETRTQLKKSKKRKQKASNDDNETSLAVKAEPKKKKRNQQVIEGKDPENASADSISKRSMKRMKHEKIMEEKKIESSKNIQQNALNYLSNWKYNKSEWKFEKLKQVWLAQNLYDSTKIDDKYWENVVEYFASSQGKVHKEILEKAVKIIEDEEIELNEQLKFKRARDIIQSLQ